MPSMVGNPLDNLRLLASKRIKDPFVQRREAEVQSGLDDLLPEVDSPELHAAQTDIGNKTGTYYSRDALRGDVLSKLRTKLGLSAIEHEQDMERVRAQEEGLNLRAKLMSRASSQPYFSPVTTATGVQSFDHRTGEIHSRIGDLKPGDATQGALADVGNALFRAGEVRKLFKPEWTGPLAGRFNSMEIALIGDDARKAQFQAFLEGLRNTVIKARTGAQMSEPEAARILAELPGFNLPPTAFMAKLDAAVTGLEDWYRRREAMAYGRPNAAPDAAAIPSRGGSGVATGTPLSARELIEKYRRR